MRATGEAGVIVLLVRGRTSSAILPPLLLPGVCIVGTRVFMAPSRPTPPFSDIDLCVCVCTSSRDVEYYYCTRLGAIFRSKRVWRFWNVSFKRLPLKRQIHWFPETARHSMLFVMYHRYRACRNGSN